MPRKAPPQRALPAAPLRLPRGPSWLIRVMQETAIGIHQLRLLLDQPETAALIQAAPQAGRLIRPLCHMLGVDLPPWLRRPRRPRTPKAPPAPAAAAQPAPATPARPAEPGRRPPPAATRPEPPPRPRRRKPPTPAPVPQACGPPAALA